MGVKTADGNQPAVLVIGAGTAGIVTGYFLQQRGIPYQIVDQAHTVGATWAGLYPSLKLNTSRYFSHLPGKRFPRNWGIFPTAQQYHQHVSDFVAEHNLNVRLGVCVHTVTPENVGYWVETSEGTVWYPVVVLATGRFSNPYTAPIPGLDTFAGIKLHAHDYTHPDQLAGLQVMVVGNGPSGMDIAIETGAHNAPAKPTLLAMRTGITLKRRYPLGISKHGWMLLTDRLPNGLRRRILDWVEDHFSDYPPQRLAQIKTPTPGQASSAASTRGPELIEAVERGDVICVDAPAQIHPHHVTLADGRDVPVEALVVATGYRPALGFLRGITITPDDQGWPARFNSRPYPIDYRRLAYRGTYAVGTDIDAQFKPLLREVDSHAGLFHVGLYYKGRGTLYNINVEAEVAAAQIAALLGG